MVHPFVSHAWKMPKLGNFVKVSPHKKTMVGNLTYRNIYILINMKDTFSRKSLGLSVFCSRPRPLQEIPPYLCPDRNKVNFIPKSGSAFCLVSILKPLLPTQELNFRSGVGYRSISPSLVPLGGVAVRSLSPSMGPVLSRGRQSPCLPRHLEEPEG